jgi:hypothetical protein
MPRNIALPDWTIERLRAHVDSGRDEQNGHGFADLESWILEAKKYHEPPAIAKWAKRMNRDWRTMRDWVDVFNRGV